MTEFERWSTKVILDRNSDCWLWTGAKYRGNYGHFRRRTDNKWTMAKAHRYSYEYFNECSKESMIGFCVCHTCDNPSCVNPEHLFLSTSLGNVQDKIAKGRHRTGRTPGHKFLSVDIAMAMRNTYQINPNLTYKELGKLYDTSATQAFRVIKNLIWKVSSKEV